jgi:lauroyl/myristoyl acyltransferase/acyl carrier protein
MVIEDKTLVGLQPESFQRVLAPKCDGAWNLHALGLPLDFFVMCSSVVSLLGSAGQGSYAAANSFLDSLADYRRSRGLPALTINWGLLGEIGYVSRNHGLKAGLESAGLSGLRPDEATSALGRLLGSTLSRAGIVRMNWGLIAQQNSSLSVSARLENLIQAPGAAQAGEGSSLRARFDASPPDQLPGAMLSELKEQMAVVLRSSPSKLDEQSSLNALGLDSLMALELTSRIERELGMRLPVGTIHSGTTLARLSEVLCESLNGGKPAPRSSPKDLPASEPALEAVVPAIHRADSFLEQPSEGDVLPRATWQHQIEAVALRVLIALLRKGDLASAHRRLHRLMPLSKVFLRNDWQWTDRNLSLVFGQNLSPAERTRLAELAFENHLRSYLEGLRATDYVSDFHNFQHILDVIADGRGVILCGVHLGTWEPVFRIAKQVEVPVVCVYRRAQNPLSNQRFQEIRATYQIEWIEKSDVAGIALALDEKKVVALMTDLNTVSGGLQADFLGIPAMNPAGPAKLAMIKNCPLVPAMALRAPGGRVDVHFEAPIYPGDELPAELTRRINAAFEPWILEYAEQYNWLHPRWRARPDGSSWDLKMPQEELQAARKFPCYEPSARIRSLLA